MLIDIATATPPYIVKQQKAAVELKKRMGEKASIAKLIDAASIHSGIETRYVIIPDGEEQPGMNFYSSNGTHLKPDTQSRMEEYEKWSKRLASSAVTKLLEKNSFSPSLINRLITISCTGFFAPGLDYHLMSEFKIPFNTKRTNIGFMGCAASITGFTSVTEALNSEKDKEINILLLSVELCSIHLQTEPKRDNILANMIFADGCAAALFSSHERKGKFRIISTRSVLFPDSEKFMGWKIGNYGFEMALSSELPKIIFDRAVPALKNLLAEQGLDPEKIKYWALHPGGRAILDSLQTGLALSDEKMAPSRNILRNYGNMSSASILYVLREIMDSSEIRKDDYCCAVAFGPGLSMEVAIFKGA